jgi:Tfp pilus assembly protein PilO
VSPTAQLVLAIVGTIIGVAGLASPFVLNKLNKRDRKIELLETKNELLEKANHKLEMQNLELRVTGVAVNKLLRQLPSAKEADEEKL